MMTQTWLFLSMSLLINNCGNPTNPTPNTSPSTITEEDKDKDIPYQLNKPTKAFTLPVVLTEISGICPGPDPNTISAVQDEAGKLFFINNEDGKVGEPMMFEADGDFEDLVWVHDVIYFVKSKGKIYEVQNIGTEAQKIIKHETPLTKQTNIEGLCYDATNNRLLLAQKGQKEGEMSKNVYAFDLATKKLSLDPVYTISLEDIQSYLRKENKIGDKWHKFLENDGIEMNFGPSAIAIHPVNGSIFILSSIGKVLVVLNEKGKIIGMAKLDKEIHTQPEGMTFWPDGTLYISNEGKDGKAATLYQFDMQ